MNHHSLWRLLSYRMLGFHLRKFAVLCLVPFALLPTLAQAPDNPRPVASASPQTQPALVLMNNVVAGAEVDISSPPRAELDTLVSEAEPVSVRFDTEEPAPEPTEPQYIPVAAVGEVLGSYSPHTRIELRGSELWYVRPPYESPLQPRGDGTYTFTQGWRTGQIMQFAYNEASGISMLLLADDGIWREFARSGEVYPDFEPELRFALEGVLNDTLANYPGVPGVAMYVHIPNKGIWMGARGVSSREQTIPLVPHDRFHVASVSKTLVATIILQLAEEGVLSLEDTVEQWMPGILPNGNQVKIRHLLNHTSGVPNYLEGWFIDAYLSNPGRFWQQHELVGYAAARPSDFPPGSGCCWRYSNTNFILLGMIIEHATGTSTAQQVRWRILEPLAMTNTYFEPYEETIGGVAHGYNGGRNVSALNMSIVWAAGGLVSNTADLGRFITALANGELLGPAALEQMHQFVNVHGAWGTRDLTYGLGLMQSRMSVAYPDGVDRPYEQGIVRGHTGSLAGTRTSMWYLPDSGITIVVAANQIVYDTNITVTAALDAILAHQDLTQPVK